MPRRPLHLAASAEQLRPAFAAVRERLEVPGPFPPAVLEAARDAAAARHDEGRLDLPLITIDPPGSQDLDQALHLARRGSGYRINYAIADVADFVTPGSALDDEAWARGVTHYGPDERAPLHPAVLSEGAASLLPGQDRPAVVWQLDLDADGRLVDTRVRRATVRSQAQLTYAQVQADLDAGTADMLALLPEIGARRRAIERERGGVALPLPDQEIERHDDHYRLEFRRPRPVEQDNAQLSLLTGIVAADLMRSGRVGIQRTLPPADDHVMQQLRATAAALDIDWPDELGFHELVPTLDPQHPSHAAFLDESTVTFRGADYVAFDGARPPGLEHAGIAANYAHVTAPLRRLVDRYTLEACLALSEGDDVPDWVRARLYELPEAMASASRRASAYERAVIDVVEAALLSDRVGHEFDATVIDVDDRGRDTGWVLIPEPAVRARVEGDGLALGERIRVRVVRVDIGEGVVELRQVA